MANKIIKIDKYLTEVKKEILNEIKQNKRLLLSSNPATGKTSLFSEICIENKEKKHFNRIVFCAPFLIIQAQFKEKLNEGGLKISLELNHNSKRKFLKKNDNIITSTFKSFHWIHRDLSLDDLVIVDEAHSLLMMFQKKMVGKVDYDFYNKFYSNLFSTKARVVLMTGTPSSSLKQFFSNLFELKILNNSIKAKINIQKSSDNIYTIVSQFSAECIKTYGTESLNVIYIKSLKDSYSICEYINKLGFTSQVLTSQEKEQNVYKQLVEKSLIPSNIQFLVTTNVISTGVNILNENIGKALMLNEYNPIEIKQFSKRFRKKLDIEIDVVNRFKSKKIDFEQERKKIIDLRKEQRIYVDTHIHTRTILIRHRVTENYNFNEFAGLGSGINPNNYLRNILDRNLLQEIFYSNQLIETFNNEKELSQELMKFDDLIPLEIQENYLDKLTEHNLSKEEYNRLIENVFFECIKSPVSYLLRFSKYLNISHHYSNDKKELDRIIHKLDYNETIIDNTEAPKINILIYKEIIQPFLQIFDLFESEKNLISSIQRCLYFLMNNNQNKRKKFLVSLWFNKQFQTSFSVIKNELNDYILHQISSSFHNEKLIKFLLETSFSYATSNNLIYYNDFEKHLLNAQNNNRFEINNSFYWADSIIIKDGKIVDISRDFGLGILQSIIAFNDKALTRKHPTVTTKNRVQSYEPVNLTFIENKFYPNDEIKKNILSNIKTIDIELTHKFGKGFDLNKKQRVILNQEYLTYSILDNNFYEIIK